MQNKFSNRMLTDLYISNFKISDAGRLLKGEIGTRTKTNPRLHHLRVLGITTKRENNNFSK